jgi:hypothetical protein
MKVKTQQACNKQDMVDASLYKQWGTGNKTTTVESRAHCALECANCVCTNLACIEKQPFLARNENVFQKARTKKVKTQVAGGGGGAVILYFSVV